MERKTSLQITRSLQTSCLTPSNPWFITGFADAEGSFSIPFFGNYPLQGAKLKDSLYFCQVKMHFTLCQGSIVIGN